MGLPKQTRRFTVAEYYELEHNAEHKSDYYDGEIFAMAGGTANHARITANITRHVDTQLIGGSCAAYSSDMRLKVRATGLRVYPDVSVYCGPLEFDEQDPTKQTATNPSVLIEVLSPSTEACDRGLKSLNYRRIDSLRAYALVYQDRAHIELYERQPDGNWLLREEADRQGMLSLTNPAIKLSLAEVYDRVDFAAAETTEV